MVNAQAGYMPQPVPTGTDPCEGRKAIHVLVDFSLGSQFNLDLSQIQSQGAFASAQTLYIDNADNAGELTVTMGLTLQRVVVPANSQMYIPILQANPPVLQIVADGGTPVINFHILNFFVPPYVWYPGGIAVEDLTLESVISNGAVNTNTQAQVVTNPTDHSGTITTGGTKQQLMAANATRKRWILSNPTSATEVLSFTYTSTPTHFIDLAPGQTWDEADFSVSGDAIEVVAATTAHAFTSFEW